MDDAIKYLIEKAGNPSLGMRNYERFLARYREENNRDYKADTPSGRLLLRIFGNSHALSERLISHPEWADRHAADAYATQEKPRERLVQEIEDELSGIDRTNAEEMCKLIRHIKYREMIRLVARDLDGHAPVHQLLLEWSNVADLLIETAYHSSQMELTRRYGETCSGAVIALGKLGGGELNLSSDVDLLFIYRRDSDHSPSPHEFYVKLTGAVTKLLSRVTDDGFAFRVDHDLRPEGAQGPLANSLDAAERYYAYFGQHWERQALIRARPIAGDLALGQEFVDRVRPFVYRRTLGLDDLTAMRRMKERMSEKKSSRHTIDIKHDSGGIRSVEFLVQALQLIYGGFHHRVREPNVFSAVDLLTEDRLIHSTSGRRLKEAYAFLRRIENMIQMVREQQVHQLPDKSEEIDALARRMDYHDGDGKSAGEKFERDLDRHMENVKRLFQGMFEADYERIELIEAIEENLTTCKNEEEVHDSIPWFKDRETGRIKHLDLAGKLDLPEVLSRLTLVAEVVIATARRIAWDSMTQRYGIPRDGDGAPASLAIVGMGKLGSREVDYGSDLDLLFTYSSEGETDGERSIDNREFFARLAQRIISLITITSRYGRAYEVDSELRPSGRSGMLVTTHEAFLDYHLNRAEPWERMSLLRARAIDGQQPFIGQFRMILGNLAFELPRPDDGLIVSQMRHLKKRMEDERARDDVGRYDIKHGRGGIFELDTVIQFLQLRSASKHPSLRIQNTFRVLDALAENGLVDQSRYGVLSDSLMFYRKLLSRIRLFSTHATDVLDVNAEVAKTIAKNMGFDEVGKLEEKLIDQKKIVRGQFDITMK